MATSTALLKEQIQSALGPRCEAAFLTDPKPPEEVLSSLVGEIPRGAITEIVGPASSGRMSLLYSLLAAASSEEEFCAILDAEDTFDPASAAAAGVRLSQVLWIRCGGIVEHVLKSADMLAQAGGFGLIAIDLSGISARVIQRIPLAAWFRLRHAVENTRTALLVVAQQIHAYSCSALKIELRRDRTLWRGPISQSLPAGCLLDGFEATARCIRQHRAQERPFPIAR
jgi:recombination protein RecA